MRFNLSFLVGVTPAMMEPVARRIAPLGWHLVVNGTADKLLAVRDTLLELPAPLLVDHMGQLPQPEGVKHPGFALLSELLDRGGCWIKLSGAYLQSRSGAPDYADAGAVASALIRLAPERMVWGSDWPASDQEGRRQARRRAAARPARRLDADGGGAPPHPGRQPGAAVRLLNRRPACFPSRIDPPRKPRP